MPKMTPRIRRIPAVPSGQGPRAGLVEARGSDPRRFLRRQRTLSVCPFPAFPIPLESFPLESFPLESFPLESFPLESFALESFALESFALESFPLESF
jgi:hypothetical protein